MRVVIRRLLGEQIVDGGVLGSGKKEDAMWHVPQRYPLTLPSQLKLVSSKGQNENAFDTGFKSNYNNYYEGNIDFHLVKFPLVPQTGLLWPAQTAFTQFVILIIILFVFVFGFV